MLASASIPGVFEPVYFDVDVAGEKYDEMHVDGGIVTLVFGYGPNLIKDGNYAPDCDMYVLINGRLASEPQPVSRKSLNIFERSFLTLWKAHSWADIHRIYSVTRQDKVNFNYVCIPDNYQANNKEMFDPAEMKKLFDLGYQMGKSEDPWQKEMPDSSNGQRIWMP